MSSNVQLSLLPAQDAGLIAEQLITHSLKLIKYSPNQIITLYILFPCPGRGPDSRAQPERVREEQGEGAQGKHSVPNTVSNRFDETKSSMSTNIQNLLKPS